MTEVQYNRPTLSGGAGGFEGSPQFHIDRPTVLTNVPPSAPNRKHKAHTGSA